MQSNVSYRWLILVLLAMFALLTVRINAGWYGHHDENGRWISTAVRNYELYGMEELGYLVTTTPGPADPTTVHYYVNHPPLIVWMAWLSAKIFGFYQTGMPYPDVYPREMSVRLVSIFATMISLSAFYVMCRRLLNSRLALLCLIFYSFTPMVAYFGRMPNHEPLALPFIYLFAAVFVNWMRRFTPNRSILLSVLAIIAMWTAWASAFFFAALGIVALVYGRKQHRIVMVGIGLVTLLATISIPLFYEMQQPGAISDLVDAFVYRTSNRSFNRESANFTLSQYVVQLLSHMIATMSFGVVILGLLGFVLVVRIKNAFQRAMIFALLLACIGYMLVFRNAFHIHDYYKIFFMPSFVIGTAIAADYFWKHSRRGWGRYARPLVVSVIFCSLIAGAFWFVQLHRTGLTQIPRDIVLNLPQYTTEADLILTNLAEIHPSIDYYTYRTLEYGVAPETALEIAADSDETVKYLYCAFSDEDINVFNNVLSNSSSETISDVCQLVMLN